jgi:two-component system sensor histidine kinase DegS
MNVNFEQEAKAGLNRFTRLGTWYILALSVIASVAIIGQILIQDHLESQQDDSRVVNVAGKQRMLSQKITKSLLLISHRELGQRGETIRNLSSAIKLWGLSQEGLLHGNDSLHLPGNNSEEITKMFEELRPHYEAMFTNATEVVATLSKDSAVAYDRLRPMVDQVLANESKFLAGMEKIVFQYDSEAHEKVAALSTMEYFLMAISILVIILEIVFIFRPTTLHVSKTISKLIDSERNAKKLSKEIGALYASLEKSYEQISHINEPVENPKLFAKADRGGNIIFISPLFTAITGISESNRAIRVSDLFEIAGEDDWMDDLIETVTELQHFQRQLRIRTISGKEVWSEVIISPVYNDKDEIDELIILGADITRQKNA